MSYGKLRARTRRAAAGLAVVAAGMMALALAAGSADAASWPYTQTATPFTFPSGAQAGGGTWSQHATGCATGGWCVAVGQYQDSAGMSQAYVVPIHDGVLGAGMEVPLPTDASTADPYADLQGVACQAGGVCEAYGYYLDTAGNFRTMVTVITDGVPAPAVALTLPSDAAGNGQSGLESIACPTVGACVGVGYYTVTGGAQLALVVPVVAGRPGTAVAAPLPAAAMSTTATTYAQLASVACQSAGACVAVGTYYLGPDSTPIVVPITGGVPAQAIPTLPSDASTGNSEARLRYVACPPTGACEAIGYYQNTSGTKLNMVVPINAGVPGNATAVTPAPGATSLLLVGFGCSSSKLCVAAGRYLNGSNPEPAVTLVTAAGATSQPTPLPADAGQTPPAAQFETTYSSALGCAPAGPCVASGIYYLTFGANRQYRGLLQQITANGQLGPVTSSPTPAGAASTPQTELYGGTACVDAGSCVTTGSYATAGGTEPYAVTEQAPLSLATTELSAATQNSPYQASLSATGAWGDYSWSVTGGALPSGLTLNSATGVISGTPTGSGTAGFTVTVTAPGAPAQTVSRQLSLSVTQTVTTAPVPAMAAPVPVVALLHSDGRVSHNRVAIRLRCTAVACHGTLKLTIRQTVTIRRHGRRVRSHRTLVIGRAGYTLAAGSTRLLRVGLDATGRRVLASAAHHRLRITVLASVAGGHGRSRQETIAAATGRRH